MTAKLLAEFDLQDGKVIEDKLAPVIGTRVGEYFGNATDLIAGLQGAAQLLTSGDGIGIATSMAGFIKAFTGWLRTRSEQNAEQTHINRQTHQATFMRDCPVGWMVRRDVGATRPLESVILKRSISVKMSDMLKQYAPGATFAFLRPSWDVLRRSFPRTDAPNAFDDGQPDIYAAIPKLSDHLQGKIRCMSDVAALGGRGCCYYPGERIQFSFGTYPYLFGYSVADGSDSYVDPEVPIVRHAALMTPSAHHVLVDEADVYRAYIHWSMYVRLKDIPPIGKGQKDPGIYIDDDGLPYEVGGKHYWQVDPSSPWPQISGAALRDVTTAFFQFFVVRQMVLRQFEWLAPSVKEAAKQSKDERIKKLAHGEKVPLWQWDAYDPLLQLEQLPDGPQKGAGKPVKAAPAGGSRDDAKPGKQETETAPAKTDGVSWIEIGAILAGVGGAAYAKRRDIIRWIRERVR